MKTWILISNAGGARVFSTAGQDSPLHLVRHVVHARSQAPTTDKPGRGRTGSSGRGMFAMPSHTSGKDLEGEDFAHELSQVLRVGLERHQYERVALLAPPHFLGLLTKSLGPEVSKHVSVRQDSDYTHVLTTLLPGLLEGVRSTLDTVDPPAKARPAR